MTDSVPVPLSLSSNRAPIAFETDIAMLPLRGSVPDGLEGVLVRNGPNPVVPDAELSWFAGDGMLHGFRLQEGRVGYINRWIRTKRWEHATQTGRNLASGGLIPTSAGMVPLPGDDGYANTSVVAHAGRMLALEEAHMPIRMDPATLGTLGVDDFDGKVAGAFTAHPKTCPLTGELLFFGYGTPERLSADMQFGVIARGGQVLRVEGFQAPYASMVHDFAVTENHVVLPIMPLTASRERAVKGGPAYAWEPEFGTRVGIMRRSDDVSRMAWWSGPTCYVFHVMNAWECGDDLYVDVMQFDKAPMFPTPDGRFSPTAYDEIGQLVRWHFDLSSPKRHFSRTVLSGTPGEFPRIDERRSGLSYRHGWYAGSEPKDGGGWRSRAMLVHIDHDSPKDDLYRTEPGDSLSEPVFVARSDAEGDGWVLATVYRAATKTSELLIFEARNVAAGPICTAFVPHRIPDGFHGQWFPRGFDQEARSQPC